VVLGCRAGHKVERGATCIIQNQPSFCDQKGLNLARNNMKSKKFMRRTRGNGDRWRGDYRGI